MLGNHDDVDDANDDDDDSTLEGSPTSKPPSRACKCNVLHPAVGLDLEEIRHNHYW